MGFVTENWETVLAVTSALIAVGAMLAAISQARSAKGARVAADKAVAEAKRSADASEASAEAAARSAAADEEMARLAKEQAEREARYVVPWKVEHISRNAYRLVNDSEEDAFNVRIAGDVATDFEDRSTVPSRTSVKIIEAGTFDSDEDLRVTWQRPDGSTHAWKYAL